MSRIDLIRKLNMMLLEDMPSVRGQISGFSQTEGDQRLLLRSLMNIRPPMSLRQDFLRLQDELLSEEREEKGIVDGMALPPVNSNPLISVWQGDITTLKVDAIVDADNSALLGCFCPCHGCIDNAIHSAAGLQLRDECNAIMQKQGHEEPAGQAKLTRGYNLPSKYVLHTVGPIIRGKVTESDCRELSSCYWSCLNLAAARNMESLAFCCISTGEYRFPNEKAAEIAVDTVKRFLKTPSSIRKVIFNVFKDTDAEIYRRLLDADSAASR